jgi:protocatechuate 4,5-dioxygenase alpha subunit
MKQDIPGTIMFDGEEAQKGLALNRMCFSFNKVENRNAFLKDEDAYCAKYGLNDDQGRRNEDRSPACFADQKVFSAAFRRIGEGPRTRDRRAV